MKLMIENRTPSLLEDIKTADVSQPVLHPHDRQKILYDWNQTYNEYQRDKTIQDLLEEQVAAHPDNIALVYAEQSITYAELNSKANQLAHYLLHSGVKPDNLIAVCMEASFDLFIAILAILKTGCAYLPLDPNYPAERRQYMLDDTNAACLITHSSLLKQFGEMRARVICLDTQSHVFDQQTHNPNKFSHADSLMYVIYTSGSTGKPKGVMLTHHNVHNFINWITQALEVNEADIFDFSSSISFDFSVFTTILPLVKGASIAICPEGDKKDPELYSRHLHKNKVTIIKLTPSYFRQLKEFIKPEYDFKDLRWIVFGGELLLAQDIQDWLKQYPHHKILNEYGPTEAAVATSWIKINKHNVAQFTHGIPIGKAAYNTQLYILDANMNPLPPGVEGELYIGGEGVAKGYLNQPEMTSKRFVLNPFKEDASRLYRTGDLCRFLPDGNIEFIGRVDHQVKIRGFRIETSEIEMRLAAHTNVREAVVIARDDMTDQTGEKRLVAYCLLKDKNTRPDPRYLREFLHRSLPDYMIPAAFVLMDSFPLTTNGKLDRKALPEPEQINYHHYHAPRTALEQIIADIWSEVLNLEQIGVNDNFFELGGHSLSGARIISKIMKATHKDIKLADLYDAPTISQLANVVGHAAEADKKNVREQQKYAAAGKGIPLGDMQFLLWFAQKSYSKSQTLNIVTRKRFSGLLDMVALRYAFECVLKTHQILNFYMSPYKPLQYVQEDVKFDLEENDISALSFRDQEDVLMDSLAWLKTHHHWQKGRPLLEARLFRLADGQSEIQLAISHMAGDEFSPEIIFKDLSQHYLDYKNNKKIDAPSRESISYFDYALEERDNLDLILKRDMPFWGDYLKDISLFSFPKEDIIYNISPDEAYTTYIEIDDRAAAKLQTFCILNRLSMLDSLCAVTGSVLTPYLVNKNGSMALNVVKSTRHDDRYDDTVGCFVTTNLIKMKIDGAGNIVDLAKQAQKSTGETAPHQFCPPIVKFAYLFQSKWKRKKIRSGVIKACMHLTASSFPSLQLHPDVLNFYGKMALAESNQHFLVQVNMLNSFIGMNHQQNKQQFGLPQERLDGYRDPRIVAKNVLDIRFERDSSNRANLVLSCNLSKHLREKIGGDILNMLLTMM